MAPARRLLESWKAIAEYVGRDVRTVMRWERDRHLPVRRLPGGKSSTVFAYTDEIDAWQNGAVAPPSDPEPALAAAPRPPWPWLVLAALAATFALAIWIVRDGSAGVTPDDVARLSFEGDRVIATDAAGRQLWAHHFDQSLEIVHRRAWTIADLDDDGRKEVVVGVAFKDPSGHGQHGDVLHAFSAAGTLRWTLALDDRLTFGSETYTAPWVGSDVHVYGPPGARAIAWSVHHYTWWPSLVVRVDPRGRITSRFVHPGWLSDVNSTPDGRWLIASGVNNALDAAVTAILNGRGFGGTVPASGRPDYDCATCGEPRLARYLVYPRSEVNAAAPFRLGVTVTDVDADGRIQVHVIQTDNAADSAEVIYELAPDFTIRRATYSDSYWRWHQRLEADGRLRHAAGRCAERDAPLARLAWPRVTVAGEPAPDQ